MRATLANLRGLRGLAAGGSVWERHLDCSGELAGMGKLHAAGERCSARNSDADVIARQMLYVLSALLFLILPIHAQTKRSLPHILGIAHAAFRVSDMDKAELFYGSALGYEEPFSLNDGIGKAATAFVKVNDLQYVELFQGDATNQGQLDHFALYTDDLTSMRAYLQGLGMYIAKDTHKGGIGNPFFTIRDPEGHFVEILQYTPNSLTGRSQGKSMPDSRISDHITHVGIGVKSVDSAMKFYRDALGFREISRGAGKNGEPGWIDLQAPDGSDYIELITLSGKPSSVDLKKQNHLGLASTSVHNTFVTLLKRVPPSSPISSVTIQAGGGLPPRFNVLDPDGARIEIMEPLPESIPPHEDPARSQ